MSNNSWQRTEDEAVNPETGKVLQTAAGLSRFYTFITNSPLHGKIDPKELTPEKAVIVLRVAYNQVGGRSAYLNLLTTMRTYSEGNPIIQEVLGSIETRLSDLEELARTSHSQVSTNDGLDYLF